MASTIKVALGVDGAKDFQNAMRDSNAAIKTLSSELKLATAQFGDNIKSEEGLTAQNDILERTILTLKEKLDEQERALAAVGNQFGEASAETQKFQQEVNKTKTEIANAENQIRRNNDAIKELGEEEEQAGKKTSTFGDILKANLTSEAIISGVKKLTSAIKDVTLGSAALADELLTQSSVTGLSTETLQEYRYMAGLVDVDVETLTGSMTKLIRNMDNAKSGTGDAAEAFQTLGIDVTDSNGELRSAQGVFDEIISRLGEMTNETERDALAMSIFGKSAQDLNPLIKAGSDAIAGFREEAHKTGYVLDSEALATLGATDDAVQRMNTSLEAAKNELGVKLAPVVTAIIFGLTAFVSKLDELLPVITAVTVAVGLYAAAMAISTIIDKVKKATEGMTLAQAALNAVMNANPIMIIVSLIAALVTALITAYQTNDEFRAKVDAAWTAVKETVQKVFDKIKETIEKVKDWFKELPQMALGWGKDLLESFVSGIKEKIQKVKDTISNVAQTVKDFLGFSEPKRGPLSNFHTYAPDMMDLYAKGIRENSGIVANALDSSLAAPIFASGTGASSAGYAPGGMGEIVINLTSEIDGAVLARTQYRYNQAESVRHGGSLASS